MTEFKDVTKLDMQILNKLIAKKTYREFIQLLLLKNKKGENGLLVKNLRNFLSSEEESIVVSEINRFNNLVENRELWERPAGDILNELDVMLKKQQVYNQSRSACYLLLFTMNYVFFCYGNRTFRNFLDVKIRRPFKFYD